MSSPEACPSMSYSIPETVLYPRSPMRLEDFKSSKVGLGLSGSLKDFGDKPKSVNKGDTLEAEFELVRPMHVEGLSVYCVKPKSLPNTDWMTPKIIVKVFRGINGDQAMEYTYESLAIPQSTSSCFSFANLPMLSPITKIEAKVIFPCDTLVSTILCFTDDVSPKTKQLRLVTEEYRKMLSGSIIPFNFQLVSTLPNGGDPVPCHKFPIKMLLDGKLEGDKLELPLSNEALIAIKKVAYGDLSAIVDVETPISRLVMGSGDVGPHLIPTGVLREFGIAAVFVSIGHLINSSTLVEVATSQLLAKNIFDCSSDVISWVLANGSPNIGLELYERIKMDHNILNKFELKEPLLQLISGE